VLTPQLMLKPALTVEKLSPPLTVTGVFRVSPIGTASLPNSPAKPEPQQYA